MNWKTTWMLLSLAVILFGFIYLVEQHSKPSFALGEPPPRLAPFRPRDVTSILLRHTNAFVLRAARTNDQWLITQPIVYPAKSVAVEQLLEALSQLTGQTQISLSELSERNQTLADFGLDNPSPKASLTLEINGVRNELSFGRKTPLGDHVYFQVQGRPDIYVVPAAAFDRLPQTPTEWRSPTLIDLSRMNCNRLEVRQPGGGFEIHMESKDAFYLTKPTLARADIPKAKQLFLAIVNAPVSQFVSDDPRAELEPLGLSPPQAELILGWGTNTVFTLQFGKSPTNDPESVYARCLGLTNIVLTPKSLLDALRIPPAELRDRHILSFDPANVMAVEVRGFENFNLRQQSNNFWIVSGNPSFRADNELVRRFIRRLLSLEGAVEKDVVTDFGHYGLADPIRQYILKTVVSDPTTGELAVRVLDQLDIGALQPDRVLVRRPPENTVYSIPRNIYAPFPTEAWQLRDRNVWTFTTNQVRGVTLARQGVTRRIVRNSAGGWTLAPGSSGVVNTAALNSILEQIGQLQAEVWTDRTQERKALYGLRDEGYRMEIELANGGSSRTLVLEFGGMAPSQFPYAMATVDGQSWIFEFPLTLFVELLRDLPIQSTP